MLVEIMKINKEEEAVVSSLDVAETFGKRHDHTIRDIEELKKDVPNFGEMFFEEVTLDSYGRNRKIYYMNRDGFVLLVMGYTGEKAMQFKLAYIRQFNAMQKELNGKIREREKGISVRQAMTKALQQTNENERMHGHAYSVYTDVVYKAVFGKTAKQLREEYGIDRKGSLRDCFSQEELRMVESKEMLVSGLIGCGWGYNQIKDFISQNNLLSMKEC